MNDIFEELAKQLRIQNRLNVLRELYKMQYFEPEDYIYELREIEDELR